LWAQQSIGATVGKQVLKIFGHTKSPRDKVRRFPVPGPNPQIPPIGDLSEKNRVGTIIINQKAAAVVAAIVYAYYRRTESSRGIAADIGLRHEAVRQILWKVRRVANELASGQEVIQLNARASFAASRLGKGAANFVGARESELKYDRAAARRTKGPRRSAGPFRRDARGAVLAP
jgi:hypothetical protein